ncbi:MAG TPA: hypothetical protein VN628_01625 [Vicinamibacterales bacterium]|nr:hypothetical protein [Vicinamibacterales bacterium]
MPYTYKSLTIAWLVFFAVFAVSVWGGVGTGKWFAVLLIVALGAPALVLRPSAAALTAGELPGRPAEALR